MEDHTRDMEMEVDTVLFATGRKPNTGSLSLELAGVRVDDATGKIKRQQVVRVDFEQRKIHFSRSFLFRCTTKDLNVSTCYCSHI